MLNSAKNYDMMDVREDVSVIEFFASRQCATYVKLTCCMDS